MFHDHVTAQVLRSPRVFGTVEVKQKLLAYVAGRSHEVNGFGWVRGTPEGHFLVYEIVIVEQHSSSVHASADGLSDYMSLAMLTGRPMSGLRFQWHSHMHAPIPSAVDNDSIAQDEGDYLISVVVSATTGEMYCRLDLKLAVPGFERPMPVSLRVPFETWIPPLDDDAMAAVDEEVAAKVRTGAPLWAAPVATRIRGGDGCRDGH